MIVKKIEDTELYKTALALGIFEMAEKEIALEKMLSKNMERNNK